MVFDSIRCRARVYFAMHRMKRIVGAALAAGLVIGCSTPYQRMGFRGGCRDTKDGQIGEYGVSVCIHHGLYPG